MTRRLMAVATASLLVACGGESGPNGIDVASIQVTPNPVALAQQQSVQLQVAAFDDDGALLAGVPVTFTVGDAALATVSSSGLLQSIGPAGTTSVIVKAASRSVTVPVSIGATGSTITVLPTPASLPQRGTLQLQPALYDLVGTQIPDAEFAFASADPQIVLVDGSGLVTSVGPAGQASITVTSGGLTTQKTVTVEATPTSISVLPNPITLGRTSQQRLAVTVLDAVGSPIANPVVTFSAEPTTLLTVTAEGLLSAQGNAGIGSVTASVGTISATVPVSVVDAGSLKGVIVQTVSAAGQPFGVVMDPGGTYYGVRLGGQFDVGAFGSTSLTSHDVSDALVTGIALNPASGLIYATGSADDGLMEIDPSSGSVLRRWTAPDQMYDVAISPDGEELYVAGSPSSLYVLATSTMSLLRSYPTGASVTHVLAHPSEPLVYTSGQGTVNEINVETGTTRTFTHPAAQATALAIAGNKLFVGGEGGQLGIVDLASGAITTVDVPCSIYDLVAGPDGRQLLATCSFQGTAILLDANTFEVLATISTGGTPRRAGIRPDGLGAVIANESGWYTQVE